MQMYKLYARKEQKVIPRGKKETVVSQYILYKIFLHYSVIFLSACLLSQ